MNRINVVIDVPYKDPERQKQAQHEWYLKQRAAQVERNRSERAKRRAIVDAWKLEQGCKHCGYREHAIALDAHHVGIKRFDICAAVKGCKSIKEIILELQECIALCANCHRVEHSALQV